VWRSVLLESGILLAATATVFVLVNFLGISIPQILVRPLNLGLAVLPTLLWLIFSWLPERGVDQPRQRLLHIFFFTALVANAIGYPLVTEFFQVDRWLPLESAVNRIMGYTFTVGITQELLKFIVIRLVAWPDYFITWPDGIAYGATAAVGYTLVLSLHYVLGTDLTPDVAALRVFGIYAIHMITSIIVGYGLADLRFRGNSLLLLPLTLTLAALLNGITIPVRAGLVNTSLSLAALEISSPRPILGFAFSAGVMVLLLAVLSFLYRSAERREREALISREV